MSTFIPHDECYDPTCFAESKCRRDCVQQPWLPITQAPPGGVVLEAVEDGGAFLCAYLAGGDAMTAPEQGSLGPTALALPPLPSLPSRSFADHERYIIQLRDVMKARERILQARVAELKTVCAGHYANTVEALRIANEADARAAELEADAERYRHLLDNCYAHAPPAPKEKVYLVSTVNAADWRNATGAAIDAARGIKG